MTSARSGLLARPSLSAARPRGRAARSQAGPRRRGLVGRDLARIRLLTPGHSRQLLLTLVAILLAALLLAALRIDIIRMRYSMASAIRERTALLEERRELTAQVRSLRDPSRLARLARDRDLGWPERVIELGPEAGGPRP
jgi:cell division protein FtsL